jgi:hypothetical protein
MSADSPGGVAPPLSSAKLPLRLNRKRLYDHVGTYCGEEGKAWVSSHRSKVQRTEDMDDVAGMNADLMECEGAGWISEAQRKKSTIGKHTTLKCYAKTVVSHPGVLAFMGSYSRVMTVVYRRGSIVANLMAMEAMSLGDVPAFYKDISNATFIKKMFLPEKWSIADIPERIRRAHDSSVLDPLSQNGWEELMPRSAWDQALNSLASRYLTAIKLHCTIHLLRRVKALIRSSVPDSENAIKVFFASRKGPDAPLSQESSTMVSSWRERLGAVEGKAPKDKKSSDMSLQLFQCHLTCCQATGQLQGARTFSALPVADLSRSSFMIDRRIYTSMKGREDREGAAWPPTFEAAFSLDRDTMRLRKYALRKKKRRNPGCRKRSAKAKACARRGVGCIPSGASVTSISTDGISVCLSLEHAYAPKSLKGDDADISEVQRHETMKKSKTKSKVDPDIDVDKVLSAEHGSVLITNDPGCNLCYCFAISKDGSMDDLRYETLSAKEIARDSGRDTWVATEKRWRREHPMVDTALRAMSEGSLKGMDADRWQVCLAAQAQHWRTLYDWYVRSDAYPKWGMRLFRGKRSVLTTFVSRVLRRAARGPDGTHRRVLFGDGNGNFSPSAGAITVPTREAHAVIRRVYRQSGVQGRVVVLDEHKTSQTCAGCGLDLEKKMVWWRFRGGGGRRKRIERGRVRFCATCGTEEKRKPVERDHNAARNLMRILIDWVAGRPRPAHLTRTAR